MPRSSSGGSSRRHNFVALMISGVSMAVIYGSFDPAPAGENPARSSATAAVASFTLKTDVPLPPESRQLLDEHNVALPAADVPSGTAAAPRAEIANGALLDNADAIKFCLLLLQDGSRFLENTDSYTTVFSKQERINGDLSEAQIIDMKVRHDPCFSVYMKWKNGDAGRQLLYSDEYEDHQMCVKLGGLKGRLLPAIKLDPRGERALSESRYPVTEAGILGMLRQIVVHRQKDMDRGDGVSCRRLPNQEFDERSCYCFLFEYTTPEVSDVYRKSLILIDSRYHIPLMARNYTWARETGDMTTEELDTMTLVEEYSFSTINFGSELVAEEFSRDNPRYRM